MSTDETVTSAAAVHHNFHNTSPCFHLCDGLNCDDAELE